MCVGGVKAGPPVVTVDHSKTLVSCNQTFHNRNHFSSSVSVALVSGSLINDCGVNQIDINLLSSSN